MNLKTLFSSKRSKKNEAVAQLRTSLHDDWRLLTTAIVASMRQHWNILEDKFEQHIDEDDYGHKFIDYKFDKEIIYFSHKVVLPTLNKLVDSGKVKEFSFTLLPAPPFITENLYGIKYKDTDTVVADKYVAGLLRDGRDDHMNDELLYSLNGNVGKGVVSVSVENGSDDPLNRASLLTLNLDGDLQSNRPMKVTHLAGVVFMLFFSMYSSKPVTKGSKNTSLPIEFIGNDPYKYEEYIRKLLHARGFSAKRTRGSGDYGVDVIASKEGKTFAIQCKLFNRPVGTKAVQEIVSGRIFYRTDYAVVVSDNLFTNAAKTLARRSDVILTHHKNLLHKLEGLIPDDDEGVVTPVDNHIDIDQEPATKKQWTQQDTDELITVVLPTIDPKK
ncbi:MAG: restriction endonuclease [Candidatus Saccharimonadales bacterium]